MKHLSVPNIKVHLTVEFTENGCLDVPEVTAGMTKPAVNTSRLSEYGQLLREAQNFLDRMNTFSIPTMAPGTTNKERELFEELRRLNAETVLRVLVMRRLVLAGQIGK